MLPPTGNLKPNFRGSPQSHHAGKSAVKRKNPNNYQLLDEVEQNIVIEALKTKVELKTNFTRTHVITC